jgi:DNA-binding transcriptional LysR family regulator
MSEFHFNQIDLNLLRVFDALAEEGSVTRAGRRLGLTQSAVSHALNRLRFALNDELFVRGPEGMRATARAAEIRPQLRRALDQLQAALGPSAFVPAETTRRFAIATPSAVATLLLPQVIDRLRREAPNAGLRIQRIGADIGEALENGRVDLAIGGFGRVHPGFVKETLLEERMVWVMRAGHPCASEPLTIERLCELPLLMLSTVEVGEAVEGRVAAGGVERRVVWDDGGLEKALEGCERRGVAVTIDDAQAALAIVARTDMAALAPRRLAVAWAGAYGLKLMEPPYEARPITLDLLWRADQGDQPAIAWLSGLLRDAAAEL